MEESSVPGPVGGSYWRESWRRLRSDRLALAALIVFCLIVAVSFAAPLVSAHVKGYPPDKINLDADYASPSAAHWFGSDEYGRDYFTRIIWAGQVSLTVGFGVAIVALAIGIPLGLVAGFFGGLIDDGIGDLPWPLHLRRRPVHLPLLGRRPRCLRSQAVQVAEVTPSAWTSGNAQGGQPGSRELIYP